MKQKVKILGLGGFFLWAHAAWAAVALQGSLDLRPSWVTSDGGFHSENEIAALIEVSPATFAGYVQEFQTGLYHPKGDPSAFSAGDGYLKAEISVTPWLGIEPRLIVHPRQEDRDLGQIFAIRPVGKFYVVKEPDYSLEFWESPIVPVYQNRGEGARTFENRLEFVPKLSFWKNKIACKFPFIWQQIRDQVQWSTLLWINPEAVYSLTETTGIGLSYYSQSFIGEENSFSEGLRTGVAQLVFQQAF